MLQAIKKAAEDAIAASNPVNVLFGEVILDQPLQIKVDQRFTLTPEFLVLTERVTEYKIDLSHTHEYVYDGDLRDTSVALEDLITIRKGLEIGDNVLLLRMQGGQKYVVLDRVVST